MKKNIKKIITTISLTTLSLAAVGCGTNNVKLAKNIDKSMSNFVTSINNLDYVETAKASDKANTKYGKIVETAAMENDNKKIKLINSKNGTIQFLNNNIDEVEIENTITRPVERNDNFKLYVLSESPYITFSSDDNSANINMTIKFSTNKIEETSSEIEEKINKLILKRSILMIYVNEIYNGNVTFTEENKIAINAYVNVIKENTSYLNGNRGMVKNQLGLASDLASSDSNENLVNYYIIKSGEALETRANKLDSAISAIDSIIKIIESSLNETSKFYNSNLNATYDKLVYNSGNLITTNEITKESSNKEIADNISSILKFNVDDKNENSNNQAKEENNNVKPQIEQKEINTTLENKANQPITTETQLFETKQITNNSANNETKLNVENKSNLNSNNQNAENKNNDQSENSRSSRILNNKNRRVLINKNNKRYMPMLNNKRPNFNHTESEIMDDLQKVSPNNLSTTDNNSTNQNDNQDNTSQTSSGKYNDAKSVTNMNENEKIIMRADRTKDTTKNEEAISSNSTLQSDRFKVIHTPTVED